MVSREEAIRRARDWLAGGSAAGADVDVYEFDLGYVIWPAPPPQPGPGDRMLGDRTLGGARAVVDRETGELSVWPMLPTPVIAERYRTARQARRRFPEDVLADLRAAGWRPGRDVTPAVDAWLGRTGIGRELPCFDRARAALAEFGGLVIDQRGPAGEPGGGFASHLHPTPQPPTTTGIHEFADLLGVPVFALGGNDDGPGHLVIDERGRVFHLHPVGAFLLGRTIDEALTWMTRGGDRPAVWSTT